jgi:flagellar motor switch protein FliG
MNQADEKVTSGIPGPQKAAILLVTLGERLGGEILKLLSDEEVKAITKAIARLEKVTTAQKETVLEEFCQSAMAGSSQGGFDYAKRVLSNAFGPEGARRIAEHLPQTGNRANKEIESLQRADPQQLSRFIESEHPQTIAMILSYLPAPQAAALLTNLPPESRTDVILRLAELDSVSPDVVARVSVVITEKMRAFTQVRTEPRGGPRTVADILNRMDATVREDILNNVPDQQPLVDVIRHYMFVFEDLLMIDATAMKDLVAKIDRRLLTIALKGTSDQIKAHFLQCMSQRGAEMLREDMEAAGPVKIREVEQAQFQILTVVQQLEKDGILSLRGGGGSDQYVV